MKKIKTDQKLLIALILGLGITGCGGAGSGSTATEDLPFAIDDTAVASENSVGTDILVLSNDTPSRVIDSSSVEIITPPQNGTATVTETGEVQYSPNPNFNGADSFIYTVRDNVGNFSNPATVNITVNQFLARRTQFLDGNCIIFVDSEGFDLNANNILDDIEVLTSNETFDNGDPITRADLDFMITNGDDVTAVNTCEIDDMSLLFSSDIPFNQDISQWNVASVTNMRSMFEGAPAFNQDIGPWDVSNVTNMNSMFTNTNVNQDIGEWDVSNVTDMSAMFANNTAFNQDIGEWDVTNVTDMNAMFGLATAFNQDIGRWDVANVTDMSFMFAEVMLSSENYNTILNGWADSSLIARDNGAPWVVRTFDGGLSIPTAAGTPSRANLIGREGWTITDGFVGF